jgi:hypothetical protein
LQYIEEQSRALRDAFLKVEKRQLAKTEKFLDHLNSTVMLELKSFRNMYDQLWQSTVIELESMKERQASEMGELGSRLSLMADELVWQKRMAVVQSTLLLLCLGLVLFVRSGTLGGGATGAGGAGDGTVVERLGSKYNAFFEQSPPRSPPDGMARQRRTFRSMWRGRDSYGEGEGEGEGDGGRQGGGGGGGGGSDTETDTLTSPVRIRYSPPTPTSPTTPHSHTHSHHHHANTHSSPVDVDEDDADNDRILEPQTPTAEEVEEDQAARRIQVLETQSGPATPNGTRDCRPSWEEVERAVGLLKAEEQEEQDGGRNGVVSSPPNSPGSLTSPGSPGSPGKKKKRGGGKDKKKRSPLRRSHSNFDGVGGGGSEG